MAKAKLRPAREPNTRGARLKEKKAPAKSATKAKPTAARKAKPARRASPEAVMKLLPTRLTELIATPGKALGEARRVISGVLGRKK
jgi:hypothetical protein